MPRQKIIGRVEPIQKKWFSKKELAGYLGVTAQYIDSHINTRPEITVYRLSDRQSLYLIEEIDRMVRRSAVAK